MAFFKFTQTRVWSKKNDTLLKISGFWYLIPIFFSSNQLLDAKHSNDVQIPSKKRNFCDSEAFTKIFFNFDQVFLSFHFLLSVQQFCPIHHVHNVVNGSFWHYFLQNTLYNWWKVKLQPFSWLNRQKFAIVSCNNFWWPKIVNFVKMCLKQFSQ